MNTRSFQALELPKILDYLAGFAVSEPGCAACLALYPSKDIEFVERQAAFFEQGRLWFLRSGIKVTPFVPMDDFFNFAERPATVLDLEGLWELRRMLLQARVLYESILSIDRENLWPLWFERCQEIAFPSKSISGLQRCLNDEGLLRDEASPDLFLVRTELRRLHQQCMRKVKDYAAEYNILHYLQDAFMTLSSDRYVLPLKTNFKGKLQGIIHDYSQTGETCYFEPMFLVELNNRLQELKRQEREEERKIFLFLSGLVRDELPGIRSVYSFLVSMDVLQAKVALADCFDGRIVPFATGQGALLREARHPLLLMAENAAGKKQSKVVASTLELLPAQQALIISGGNAGGKTVSLKALGLIAAMTLCALPVPVAIGSFLPPWRQIHAFIGDEQSLDNHVSTFTAQITYLAHIWPLLGQDSLVLLDEFGAGTDPSQGAALAQAVVDAIMAKGAYVAAATHFPALKAYALSTAGVRAASVLFDPHSKKPLFRLVYDQVGASQALDVAREHGLPEEILAKASQYLLLGGEDTSALVERLNTLAVERERELADLAKEKRIFEEKRTKLTERFAKEREQLFASVRDDARRIMAEWKSARINHKQAIKELAKVRQSLVPSEEQGEVETLPRIDLETLAIRSRVRHLPWKRVGTVLEIDMRKGRVRLDLDGVSMWAEASELAPMTINNDSLQKVSAGFLCPTINSDVPAENFSTRLDVRGLRADIAVATVEKFLDSALVDGWTAIDLIHGRGTGVLRRELHIFLKQCPAVKSFRLANEDQGGDGMTIVELR